MAIIKPNNNTLSAITGLPAGVGGKVLQVVHAVDTTADSTTSGSYSATSLLASITPSSSSNKVLIILSCSTNASSHVSSPIGGYGHGAFYRQINSGGYSSIYAPIMLGGIKQTNLYMATSSSAEYLDSPNTTSQCDYKLYFKLNSGNSVLTCNDSTKKSFTLMEIEA
jgi:hypothetical protein